MLATALDELARAVMKSSPKWYAYGRAGGLSSSGTFQAQIQGFELTDPNIYLITELLGCVKGPVLQVRNYKIYMTQDNNRISKESSREVPVFVV